MIATLAALAIFAAPASMTRAEFTAALATVKDGWTRAQVEEVLGKPDDTWSGNVPYIYMQAGNDALCYGSKGHLSFPTRGRVVFRHDRVYETIGKWGTPPSPDVIEEGTLDASMRLMHRWSLDESYSSEDSAHLIKVANHLISLGQEKALAVLGEYARITTGDMDDKWLFWLVRVAFTSTTSGGVFAYPGISMQGAPPPEILRKWPTYPILIVDDIPFCLVKGGNEMMRRPESFYSYFQQNRVKWTLRANRLRPPDNPFPTYLKVAASPEWNPKYKVRHLEFNAARGNLTDSFLFKNVLALVRTAYRPGFQKKDYETITPAEIEACELGFLMAGAHWDVKRDAYVDKDDRLTPDALNDFPQVTYTFPEMPNLGVEVSFRRRSVKAISIRCEVSEGWSPIAPAVMVAEDPTTKEQLFWMKLNGALGNNSEGLTLEKALAEPPHPRESGMVRSSGFDLAFGRKIRLVILHEGKRYEGALLAP